MTRSFFERPVSRPLLSWEENQGVGRKDMSWSVIVALVLQPAFLSNRVEMAFIVCLYLLSLGHEERWSRRVGFYKPVGNPNFYFEPFLKL